jgi:hypothetical protein
LDDSTSQPKSVGEDASEVMIEGPEMIARKAFCAGFEFGQIEAGRRNLYYFIGFLVGLMIGLLLLKEV